MWFNSVKGRRRNRGDLYNGIEAYKKLIGLALERKPHSWERFFELAPYRTTWGHMYK